ncbi:hypothetical protein TrCOL_g10573 [Triparma columacea]|uniref:homogentisate 1,2-dioxygenase n=1 Tax=Triparma columacea TaxID=722753 RepID=A0A9W7GD45_9STRA|nr:hypothetical protein TrCOL_g10573 [Triparma columacea]
MSSPDYMTGFNSEFATEAIPNALPKFGNNPQKCPYDLYAEQLSGTAFTVPRKDNKRVWFYRIQPSVLHAPFERYSGTGLGEWEGHGSISEPSFTTTPNQLRWDPLPMETGKGKTFLEGMRTVAGHGDPGSKHGLAVHMYTADKNMDKECVYNSDGDFLIVPQEGTLEIQTEHGHLTVPPKHICLIPRGIVFSVNLPSPSRGYILEVFKGHFELPDLGPIGSNGLANPRDFEAPSAAYDDDSESTWRMYNKFGGNLFTTTRQGTPFNVVAWHGNYTPCCTPHGPDKATFDKASSCDLTPEKFSAGLAFMFETNVIMDVSRGALEAEWRDKEYFRCWEGIGRKFEYKQQTGEKRKR